MNTHGKEQEATSGRAFTFPDPDPWPSKVNGTDLLDSISAWISGYVFLPEGAAEAITAWAVLTWFVDEAHFAPLLALVSPTKRTGKTTVLDLLNRIVRRPVLTSGVGSTTATFFRLNDSHRPTFLVDEAERLSNDREIIGLLNAGHRRGGSVQRCADRDGDYIVRDYDAFGFRAVAVVGALWDTLTDRSLMVPIQRKPRELALNRFDFEAVGEQSKTLRQKIKRWTEDNREAVKRALRSAERPTWLNDRECDNWQGLFALGAVAGGQWPERILGAARQLANEAGQDGDPGERLIRDVFAAFQQKAFPEAIKSGELACSLGAIETSPWGDMAGGKGLSAHKLAKKLGQFGVRPRQARSGNFVIRGYWLSDLRPVFDGYLAPTEVEQVGQVSNDKGSGRTTTPHEVVQNRYGDDEGMVRFVPHVPLRVHKTGSLP